MAHAKPRVPALLVVGTGTTPVLHQEEGEVVRRLAEIVGIERAQQRVTGDAEIETVNEFDKELVSSDSVEQRVHGIDSRGFRLRAVPRP
jgi:hypothetical protein